jgi:hypothetical protein
VRGYCGSPSSSLGNSKGCAAKACWEGDICFQTQKLHQHAIFTFCCRKMQSRLSTQADLVDPCPAFY